LTCIQNCGSVEDAWRMLMKMPSPYVVTSDSVKCRQGQKALELFSTNVAKLCYFCDGAECTRHHRCT